MISQFNNKHLNTIVEQLHTHKEVKLNNFNYIVNKQTDLKNNMTSISSKYFFKSFIFLL